MLIMLTMVVGAMSGKSVVADNALQESGRRIYEEGLMPNGEPLKGIRFDGSMVEGQDAACMNCHRKSGMGGVEGSTVISPINARFLFKREEHPLAIVDARHRMGFNQPHASFTMETVDKAIEQGLGLAGENFSRSMPRYVMDDASRSALHAYLEQLSSTLSPGVGDHDIHFATILTPEVDGEIRKVVIDSMNAYFRQRNATWQDDNRHHRIGFDVYPRTPRNWVLHVWELQGPPDTWQEQMARWYREHPVFALVSGVSRVPADPIDEFCDQQKIPCLFRSADLAAEKETYYNFYFSRGVLLEAGILGSRLRSNPEIKSKNLIQIARDNATTRRAVKALEDNLRGAVARSEVRWLPDNQLKSLKSAFNKVSGKDIVMCWLDGTDLVNFQAGLPIPKSSVYISTYLGGGENAPISEAWKDKVSFIYPYELPEKRINQLAGMYAWVTTNHIPALNERIQSEVFFNMLLLSELTAQMLDNLYREYLVEKVEDIMSSGFNNSIYPSLSLGPSQRFASKGGYVARIVKNKVVPDGERVVP